MDDARGEGSMVVVPRNARDEIIRMQSFTESDEEYRCDEIVFDRPNDGPKRENQIIEPQNHFNHICKSEIIHIIKKSCRFSYLVAGPTTLA